MGKLYYLISALLLAVGGAYAAPPDSYEWWLDNDVSSAQNGGLSGQSLDFQLDVSALQSGLHSFNCRLRSPEGEYGSVFRKRFFIADEDNTDIRYEYWFDNDFSGKSEGDLDSTTASFDIDIPSLEPGLHYFNCRLNRNGEEWGSVYRKLMYTTTEKESVKAYECWLDDGYATRQTGELTAGVADFMMDLEGLQYGLHKVYYRLMRTDGKWSPAYCKAFFITSENNGVEGYEYWMDDDYAGRKTGKFVGGMAEFSMDMNGYEEGMHMFSYRLKGENGDWSAVYPTYFYVIPTPEEEHTYGYEYWLDENYDAKVQGAVELPSVSFEINLPTLSPGMHFFNCRINRDETEWGAVYRKLIFVTPDDYREHKYTCEYWLDDKYDTRQKRSIEAPSTSFDMYLPTLSLGLHFLNYRLNRDETEWSPVCSKMIFVNHPSYVSDPVAYEYWLDDEYAGRQQRSISSDREMFDIDLSGLDMNREKHWFNLRIRDKEGHWGSVYRKLINNPKLTSTPATITGYRHFANGIELEEVEWNRTGFNRFEFETELPEIEELLHNSTEFKEDENTSKFTLCYVIQLNSNRGWMPPVHWNFVIDLDKPICQSVKISYDGRYLTLKTDESEAKIVYTLDTPAEIKDATYSRRVDVLGLGKVTAKTVKEGYQDSETSEYEVRYYADNEHAETLDEGSLASAFEWDQSGWIRNNVESYRIKGKLNEADYRYVGSMESLRHLDIKDVAVARIPDNAFAGSKLISISLPEEISEYGEGIFDGAPILSSVIWNSKTRQMESHLTEGLVNPNVLIYVPAEGLIAEPGELNIVTDGYAHSVVLEDGYPYYAARNFHAGEISLTRDFRQKTVIGVSQGWETLVLPFSPMRITHEQHGAAVPFDAWDGNKKGPKPFWLYRSTADGWEMSGSIEEGVPYIIAMPNHPDYVESFNLTGNVTFSATDVDILSESNDPYVTPWIEGTEFVGTFMPVEETDILSLNVNDETGAYLPGSTFVPYAMTRPFGAYVRNAGARKQMPVFGDTSGILIPAAANDGIVVTSPAPGKISISSTLERRVQVITSTGIIMRTLDLNAGETLIVEDLPKDLYIVAGAKVLVR